jgi:predicted amidohydrolase
MTAAARSSSFKLAMLQMRVVPGDKRGNLARAAPMVAEAAGEGARLVVLPEAMDVGWCDASAAELADEIPGGESFETLAQVASDLGVLVCVGLVERAADGRVYNAAVLVGPGGDVLLHHRKVYELEIAHGCYALGDRLGVADTPLGRIGLMICADAFAPGQVVSRTLGLMGAEVIISPCAWAVPPDHDNVREPYGQLWLDNYGPVARDFQMWIAGVSNVGPVGSGPWAGHKCIGCSLLVGPDGRQRLRGPYGADAETVLYAEIAPVARPARGDGWPGVWEVDSPKSDSGARPAPIEGARRTL